MTPGTFWTDSHLHLAMAEFDADRVEVLARARAEGVRRFVSVGTSPDDWATATALAADPGVRATAGLHPHEASRWSAPVAQLLARTLRQPGVCAAGEMGLDYHYDLSPRRAQRDALADQVALAKEYRLPVVIHSRRAYADTVDILRAQAHDGGGVIHCFTYGPEEVGAFLDLGFSISFSGIVTFPKAPEIREAARLVPLERLLVETDAPYLAPASHRGKRCEPCHVALTGAFLAAHLGLDPERLARVTSANAAKLFGWDDNPGSPK